MCAFVRGSPAQEAQKLWEWWYNTLYTGCLHGPNCKTRAAGQPCLTGSRVYYKHIVTGEQCSAPPCVSGCVGEWVEG
jgi:hypothetical protein